MCEARLFSSKCGRRQPRSGASRPHRLCPHFLFLVDLGGPGLLGAALGLWMQLCLLKPQYRTPYPQGEGA